MTEIDWAHRESLRMWAVLAARGHEGAQAVASFHGLASVSPPGRPVVPAVPQSPALAGITRRTELLSSLLGAKPAAPTDLV